MLSDNEFFAWCYRLELSQQTQNLIQNIRTSEPSRAVGGGSKNVFGKYPSRKMGVTIQFESHKVELPFIYQLEHDSDVLEYYDQPSPIKLDYQSKSGRKLGVLHTPDFFVIRKQGAGWEECKTEEQLKKLQEKSPHRYLLSSENRWICPPAEEYAHRFGLYYQIRSDSEINWFLQRNLVFLEDYLRNDKLSITYQETTINRIISKQGISLSELLSTGVLADDIYTLIAQEKVYVDLENSLLAEPDKCLLFSDQQIAQAHSLILTSSVSVSFNSPMINLTMGKSIFWDGKALIIVHVGDTEVILRGQEDSLIQLKIKEFEQLVHKGKITNLDIEQTSSITAKGWDKFYQASPEDQKEALERYEAIKPYLEGRKPEIETRSPRTIRDWKAKYLKAQQIEGCGYLGLLSHRKVKGNRQRKLPSESIELMEEFIGLEYDPFNIGIAYTFVEGQWVECISQYYSEFQGHTEKELKLLTNELRKSRSQNNKQSKISAKKLAEFLSSVEAEEILLEQRLHDAQALDVFQIIDGGKTQSEKVTDIQVHKQKKTLLEHPQDSQESVNQNTDTPSLVVYEEF